MLLKMIMILLTNVFGFLGQVVFPNLPGAVSIYFNYLISYMSQGLSFIAVFLDIPYISSLFAWWISLGALILTIELMLWLWRLITGNINFDYVNEETTMEGDTLEGQTVTTRRGFARGRFQVGKHTSTRHDRRTYSRRPR